MAQQDRLIYREFLTDAGMRIVASAVIGVTTALAVWLLTKGSSYIFKFWHKNAANEILSLPTVDWLIYSGTALLTGSLIVSALLRLLPNGKVSAPPDTLHSLADPDHRVPLKTSLISTLIAGVSTASGASVGLYGPLIHFGSFVAEVMRRIMGTAHISWQTLVGCGVAAAISAAFLTPIGAALFATEFVMRRMNLRDFLPLAVASSSAWGIALAMNSEPIFKLETSNFQLGISSLVTAAILGIALGLVAIAFTKALEFLMRELPKRIPLPALGPVWAAAVLFLIAGFMPHVLGTGIEFIQSLFTTRYATLLLLLLLAAKFLATGVSVALRFYGGLFAPSLFIGAVVGAIFGNLLLATPLASIPDIQTSINVFPVISAFAVASALVGAPFAAAIIILEMTQSYQVAALGFSTCVITCYLYSGFMGRSFFDRRLRERGLSYEESTPVRRLGVTPIRQLATSLEDILHQDEQESKELTTLQSVVYSQNNNQNKNQKGENTLILPPEITALEAMDAMDSAGVYFAEVDLASIGIEDDRRYVHRERLHELAWEFTQTDSKANVLGAMQSRDFVSLYESNLARELNTEELETLELYGRLRVVKAGTTLIKQGEASRNFFILNAGLMKVSLPREKGGVDVVAWLRSGSVFGEMSFLTGEPRSAAIQAESDCIVQEFLPEFVGLADGESSMAKALAKLAKRRGIKMAH
ncbi:MAG: CIC family chloride channel protein [Candidatus Azotimanducaceae bacterium]|jgi:CIC family chloride channel protein